MFGDDFTLREFGDPVTRLGDTGCYHTFFSSGMTSQTGYTLRVFGDAAVEAHETVVLTLKRYQGDGLIAATPAGVTISSTPASFTIRDDDATPMTASTPLVFSRTHILTDEPGACRDDAAVEFGPVHAPETYTVRLGGDPGGWARVTVFDPWDSRSNLARSLSVLGC